MYVGDEGVLLIDSPENFPVEKFLQEMKQITPLPVKAVVYSHCHVDHVAGVKVFHKIMKQRGVDLRIIGSEAATREHIYDDVACEDQFRNAFLMGCVGAWSLHPRQIPIARRIFSPPVDEVLFAKRVIDEMGDGTGTVMIEGRMQDDATVKQCKVMVGLARMLAHKDPELAKAYEFSD